MLLEFRTKNYKSFVDELIFSMTAAPKQKGLDYSLSSFNIGKKKYKTISTAVIYGPNASGKTNLIGAMDTFREIVLRGNILNEVAHSPNTAAYTLQLIPNCNEKAQPTSFSIKFYDDGLLVEYSLKVKLGPFANFKVNRKILEERLLINDKEYFVRKKDVVIYADDFPEIQLNPKIELLLPQLDNIASSSLSDTELFLSNGLKTLVSQSLVSKILNWFKNKLTVIYRSDSINTYAESGKGEEYKKMYEAFLTDAIREFGITGNKLIYKSSGSKEDGKTRLYSVINKKAIPAVLFESYGTIRFANEFPFIVRALLSGGTLVMDEFDASIHPMALMNIINIFHNDEININHAQLIFNTHNPIFLNSSLLRRDEIKFVERDDETGHSVHYSLSDFKTASGVRNGEDYMDRYFINRYGAIKDIDFSPILKDLISGKKETENE